MDYANARELPKISASHVQKRNMQYRGVILDEMHFLPTHTTRWHTTWGEAKSAAEKLCKETLGKRGTISVYDQDGHVY